jgi:hypothetical protein
MVMVTSTAYQTECQPSAAALLVALSGMLRNIGAAIAAAIIVSLVDKMGIGWFMTGLAILDISCIGGLIFIRFKGPMFRARLNERTAANAAGLAAAKAQGPAVVPK